MRTLDLLDRLADKVVVGDDCWEWTAARDRAGYGIVASGKKAHRVLYELLVGPIPDGLTLDHLCCNKGCVRPKHLEPVDSVENSRRARDRRTTCGMGHPNTVENTYTAPNGWRWCRACRASARAAHRGRAIALDE